MCSRQRLGGVGWEGRVGWEGMGGVGGRGKVKEMRGLGWEKVGGGGKGDGREWERMGG